MQPAGTALVNSDYEANIIAKINAINVCADLQSYASEAMAEIQSELTSVRRQIAKLLPLTTIPTDLPSVISWITSQATPYIAAYENCLAQVTAIEARVAAVTSALESAAARIASCTVSVPGVT